MAEPESSHRSDAIPLRENTDILWYLEDHLIRLRAQAELLQLCAMQLDAIRPYLPREIKAEGEPSVPLAATIECADQLTRRINELQAAFYAERDARHGSR